MHNDISHLLVEMERFYSLENAIFPWKGKEGGRGRKGDTRHIQRGNTLTNAFDNVSGEGVVGEGGRLCLKFCSSRVRLFFDAFVPRIVHCNV